MPDPTALYALWNGSAGKRILDKAIFFDKPQGFRQASRAFVRTIAVPRRVETGSFCIGNAGLTDEFRESPALRMFRGADTDVDLAIGQAAGVGGAQDMTIGVDCRESPAAMRKGVVAVPEDTDDLGYFFIRLPGKLGIKRDHA